MAEVRQTTSFFQGLRRAAAHREPSLPARQFPAVVVCRTLNVPHGQPLPVRAYQNLSLYFRQLLVAVSRRSLRLTHNQRRKRRRMFPMRSRMRGSGIRTDERKMNPHPRALTMMTTMIQIVVNTRKFSEMFQAASQTMGFRPSSIKALHPMHVIIVSPQVMPKFTLTTNPRVSVEHVHGSISTTREITWPEVPSGRD